MIQLLQSSGDVFVSKLDFLHRKSWMERADHGWLPKQVKAKEEKRKTFCSVLFCFFCAIWMRLVFRSRTGWPYFVRDVLCVSYFRNSNGGLHSRHITVVYRFYFGRARLKLSIEKRFLRIIPEFIWLREAVKDILLSIHIFHRKLHESVEQLALHVRHSRLYVSFAIVKIVNVPYSMASVWIWTSAQPK